VIEPEAFLICDSVSRDQQTGKWIIHGVFNVIWAQRFPAIHPAMDLFFRLRFTEADAQSGGRQRSLKLAFQSPSGLREAMPALPLAMNDKGIAEGVHSNSVETTNLSSWLTINA
jgi:hypothetical protein